METNNTLKVKDWFVFKADFDLDNIIGVAEETEKAIKFVVEEFCGKRIRTKSYWCPKSVILDEDWKNYIKIHWNSEINHWVDENNDLVIGTLFLYV